MGERLVGGGADVPEQGPPPPGVRTGVDDDVGQDGDAASGEQFLGRREDGHVRRLGDQPGGDVVVVGGVDRVRDRRRDQYVGLGGEPGFAGRLVVVGAECGPVDRAVPVTGGEQCFDVQAGGVGDGALDVGHGHDRESGTGEKAGGRPAHGAQALYGDPRPGVRHPGPVQGREHGLGDAAAADQLVEADAVHLDREGVREPSPGRPLVVEEGVHRLDRRHEARLGRRALHQVLGEPQVLAGGPERLDVRAHRAQVAHQDAVRLRVTGIAVDAALGTAERDVTTLGGIVQRLLHGHASGESGHLVEGAARTHPQTAAGDPAHQPVHHQEAPLTCDVVGPGEGHEGGGGHGAPRGGLGRPRGEAERGESGNKKSY